MCKLSDFDSPHKARCQTAAKVNSKVTRGVGGAEGGVAAFSPFLTQSATNINFYYANIALITLFLRMSGTSGNLPQHQLNMCVPVCVCVRG